MHAFKTVLSALALTAFAAAPALADSPFTGKTGALTFVIGDAPAKSQFVFMSDAPLEKIRGTADGVKGTVTIADAAKPDGVTGSITVPVASMRTGNPVRDGHLQGEEWLNAKANPNIGFTIEKLEGVRVAGNKLNATATGPFALNGVSKRITIPVEVTYNVEKNALKITSKFTVALKDYNVKGKSGLVGSKVGETIAVEATMYGIGR